MAARLIWDQDRARSIRVTSTRAGRSSMVRALDCGPRYGGSTPLDQTDVPAGGSGARTPKAHRARSTRARDSECLVSQLVWAPACRAEETDSISVRGATAWLSNRPRKMGLLQRGSLKAFGLSRCPNHPIRPSQGGNRASKTLDEGSIPSGCATGVSVGTGPFLARKRTRVRFSTPPPNPETAVQVGPSASVLVV